MPSFTGVSGQGTAGNITVVISGGGGAATGEGAQDRRPRGGLDKIKTRKPPEAPPLSPIPLPRDGPPKPKPPQRAPIEIVDATLVPGSLEEIERAALSAHDIADVQAFLRDLEMEEQDMHDIADVLALID